MLGGQDPFSLKLTHACLLGHLHCTRSRELSELRATLAADKGALEGLKKEVNNTDERAQKQVRLDTAKAWRVPTLDLGTCQLWPCSYNAPGIVCSLGVLCLVMCVMFPQLRAAEQLRDEIRAERERLVGREAAVAAAEASLATHSRDMERQAAEIEHATQVCPLPAVDATHSSRLASLPVWLLLAKHTTFKRTGYASAPSMTHRRTCPHCCLCFLSGRP